MVGADYACKHYVYLKGSEEAIEVDAIWHYEPDDPLCPGGWTLEQIDTEHDLSNKEVSDYIWKDVESDGPQRDMSLVDDRDYDDFDFGDERL